MKKPIVQHTASFVKETLKHSESGHDWWHCYRVWNLSKAINTFEKGDQLIVELSALLHDISDAKFNGGDEEIGPEKAKQFLLDQNLDENRVEKITQIIRNISFRKGNPPEEICAPEFFIVRDADRLDAMGAIGIARAFSYAGYTGSELFNPSIKPRLNMSPSEYKFHKGTAINHFHEKLLTLIETLYTPTAKKIAVRRQKYMVDFVAEFLYEWEVGK